jgi:L-ectoine synthase
VIVRTLQEVEGTDRDVETPTWRSRRLVLAREKVGFSMHDTVLYAGTETRMWYANHIEGVYVVAGDGELADEETGTVYPLRPGTLYLLNGHEHHIVRAHTDLHTVCVFNPPCTGREVHDENGVYPLLREEPDGGPGAGNGTELAKKARA